MEERRGRPPIPHIEDKPRQFIRTYKNDDGTIETWSYDLDKRLNGPLEVNIEYPKDWKSPLDIIGEDQRNLPITKRTFLNQSTGKFVSYQRAKQLGII